MAHTPDVSNTAKNTGNNTNNELVTAANAILNLNKVYDGAAIGSNGAVSSASASSIGRNGFIVSYCNIPHMSCTKIMPKQIHCGIAIVALITCDHNVILYECSNTMQIIQNILAT